MQHFKGTKTHEPIVKLLLVAANDELFAGLNKLLTESHFMVKRVNRFSEAINVLMSDHPQVIILDASGNELAALELCHTIKSTSSQKESVVIMLSKRKDELMEITAFNSGADDFVIYPVRSTALVERIKVRMKRPNQTITVIHDYNDDQALKIDRESYTVSLGNHFIQLSRKEFELLYLMASNPEKLFRRDELLQLVWNRNTLGRNRTIDVHISRLRQKIDTRFITCQKGFGYRFKAG